ncbi:relaxase/mobilization nuclease domain-containing protein [Janthinobacterium sp. CAN_S7]|uniref:relaxase/mobilization nuclease domain-containing protein n=1 Tax=Janthinobacterium sp. CAN_S7 TaxID=3071704 RepID=UPI00319DEA1F
MIPHIPDQRKFASKTGKPFKDIVKYITQDGQVVYVETGKFTKVSKQPAQTEFIDFNDIINYATAVEDKSSEEEKCIAVRTHRVNDISTAVAEMNAVSKKNTRCKDPAYHIILSWPEHENPAPDKIFDAAEHALKALGLAEHQYVLAVHGNTDNMHCHIAVNRIHPDTFQSRHIEWAKKTLHLAARESELQHGWTHDNGIYLVKVDGHGKKSIVLNVEHADAIAKVTPYAHKDFGDDDILPTWHDPDSLESWLKTKVSKSLKYDLPYLENWHGLHTWLDKKGITLTNTGGGGMRLHATSPDTGEIINLPASKGLRILKRAELEKRWGKYTESIEVPCATPDLSHLTPNQISKGIDDVLKPFPGLPGIPGIPETAPGRPPAHVLARTPELGRLAEHVMGAEQHREGYATEEHGSLHELPGGELDGHRQGAEKLLPDALYVHLGDEQAGKNPDVRRTGTSTLGSGSKSQRSLNRDDSKRAKRKEERAAGRADLRQRFSQYKRFVRVGDVEHFKRLNEAKADRAQEFKDIREEVKAAKAAIPKHTDPTVRLLTNVEINAESARRKLQAESVFQTRSQALRATRTPPLSWRVWLHEQGNLGDQAAISALRGIVYQAQRDAKRDSAPENEDDDELEKEEEKADAAAYREKQYRKLMARLLKEEQEEVAIRAAQSSKMRPHEIDALLMRYAGIQWRVTGNGNIEYSDQSSSHLFTDRGNRVTFDRVLVTDEEIRLALVHAQNKFGSKLTLSGDDPIFTARMARLADDMNITILNPDMQPVIEQHRVDRVQEVKAAVAASMAETEKAKPQSQTVAPSELRAVDLAVDAGAGTKTEYQEKSPAELAKDQLRAMVLSIDPQAKFIIPDPSNSAQLYAGPIAATLASAPGFAQQASRSTYILHASEAPECDIEAVVEIQYANGQLIAVVAQPVLAPIPRTSALPSARTPASAADEHEASPTPTEPPEAPRTAREAPAVALPLAESMPAHDWLAKWATDERKTIAPTIAESGQVEYRVIHIASDGIVVNKGRSGAVYPVPANISLQVGDAVVIDQNAELRLPHIPEQEQDGGKGQER